MPYRTTPLVQGEFYHVFNRSIARQPIFTRKDEYQRGLEVLNYYSYQKPPLRFSHYKRLTFLKKADFLAGLEGSKKIVQLLAFCLMPNHVHFLIKEIEDGGISRYMSNFQNSYAKYFNIKNDRTGSLFQTRFKAVRIETDEQLLHVMRYIHLNPLTSFIIRDVNQLENYLWTSFSVYLGKQHLNSIETSFILNYFRSLKEFINFTYDQVGYQRELDKIKHLLLE